jgi:hypothetical protein
LMSMGTSFPPGAGPIPTVIFSEVREVRGVRSEGRQKRASKRDVDERTLNGAEGQN